MLRPTLIILSLLITLTVEARKVPGKIIDLNGSTKEVVFNVPVPILGSRPNFQKMQYRVVYFDESKTRKVLRPDEAREIIFTFNNEEHRMLSVNNDFAGGIFGPRHVFLQLVIDGELKLFLYYFTQTMSGGPGMGTSTYQQIEHVLQLRNSSPMIPSGLSFRKSLTTYLSDCPEVTTHIQNRDLRRRDLEIIVMEYNKRCGK